MQISATEIAVFFVKPHWLLCVEIQILSCRHPQGFWVQLQNRGKCLPLGGISRADVCSRGGLNLHFHLRDVNCNHCGTPLPSVTAWKSQEASTRHRRQLLWWPPTHEHTAPITQLDAQLWYTMRYHLQGQRLLILCVRWEGEGLTSYSVGSSDGLLLRVWLELTSIWLSRAHMYLWRWLCFILVSAWPDWTGSGRAVKLESRWRTNDEGFWA